MTRLFVPDALRFLVAGGVNTGLTAAIYFLLVLAVTPEIAYALSWLAGLIFVMVVYPDRVYVGGRSGWRDRLAVGLVTICVFLIGLAILRFLIELTGSPELSFVVTLGCTTILNFLAGRLVLRRPSQQDPSAPSA